MSEINFNLQENGYDTLEVDKYIEMLQTEYQNVLTWGEEQQNNYEVLKQELKDNGFYFTIEENTHNEVIENIFSELENTVKRIRSEAQAEADEIIANANAKSKAIVRQAMENSVEIRTDNTAIMQNLKDVNALISDIVAKGLK